MKKRDLWFSLCDGCGETTVSAWRGKQGNHKQHCRVVWAGKKRYRKQTPATSAEGKKIKERRLKTSSRWEGEKKKKSRYEKGVYWNCGRSGRNWRLLGWECTWKAIRYERYECRGEFFTLLLSLLDLFSVLKSSQLQAPFCPALALGFVKPFWSCWYIYMKDKRQRDPRQGPSSHDKSWNKIMF